MRNLLRFTLSLMAMLLMTLNANAWKFTLNSPAEGEVTELYSLSLSIGGGMLDEYPAPQMAMTCPDGTIKYFNYNDMDGSASPIDYKACTAPGTYTLNIPAGQYHKSGAANEAQTFTWTIKDPNAGGGTGTTPWTFTSVTPAEGDVTSIKSFTFTMPSGTTMGQGGYVDLICPGDINNQVFINGNSANPTGDTYITAMDTPGTYTMTIAEGKFKDNSGTKNAAMTYTWTIKGTGTGGGNGGNDNPPAVTPWTFTNVSPAEGEVESLGNFIFTYPAEIAGTEQGKGLKLGGIDGVLTLPNGTTQNVKTSENINVNQGELHLSTMTDPGTYKITFAAGAGESNAGVPNAAMTYTWTIKGSNPPTPTKDYTISYDKENECVMLAWPEGTVIAKTGNEISAQILNADVDAVSVSNNIIYIYTSLADGEYTLAIAEGQFTINETANKAISETFTVGSASDFNGEPWHETIFKAGETTVTKPIAFETEGVSITTVDGSFDLSGTMTTIPFGYNTYDEKELDWNNKCQFVITAKKDINKVIFIPTASGKKDIGNATAIGGDGEYENGVWEGKLATGETLTLTASTGIQIKEIYVCYNGDDFDPTAGGGDVKGVITIQYPVENQLIDKQVDGGKFCVFTTNKEYAQVTIEVKNSNEAYDNLFKFPTRMVDNMGENSDNLHVGENTIYAATPGGGAAGKGDDWYWFKGDSYTMIVKGYVNPWDTEYDAMAEVHFVGNGKEHVAESIVKLLNITPATSMEDLGKIAMVNGVITLEFDGAVSSVTAITPGGMSDPTINHTTTAKAGTDNKVWEINLGDRTNFGSSETEGNPIIEVDVTATAADGIVILSDSRADRGLELKYELVENAGPTTTVTLGTPIWSVAEGAEIEATTSSINIKFPNATNVEGTYTLEVSGTINTQNENPVLVSGTGTMADGADITVNLSEDRGYNLIIGTITVKDGNGATVYSTDKANFQLNFGTTGSQGGDNIEADVKVEGKTMTVTFPAGTDLGDNYSTKPYIMSGADKIEVAKYYTDASTGGSFDPLDMVVITLNEELAAGDYTLVFPTGMFIMNGGDNNKEMQIPFTVTAPAKDYTISYDKENECVMLAWPEGTVIAETGNGISAQILNADVDAVSVSNNIIYIYTSLADGEYTLAIAEGQFTINETANKAISETFTVGSASDFNGEPWHETIFKAGETTVDKNNIAFETEGVSITTVDGSFELGGTMTTIPFGYNTYDEKELDWNNKCQFVIKAKQDINRIIIVPTASAKNAINNASATGGTGKYENGVWEGKLATGETLTLTASDGIQIKEIYVCYNGDDFDPTAGGGDVKGVITIQYPTENQLIAYQTNGGKLCTFTTNKEYEQVTIEIINSNPTYQNLYAFPPRMVDNAGETSDNLHVGQNTVTASTPDAGNFYFFKGDSYKMIVKGFVHMYDVMPDNYDAIAEVNFVGNGKNHDVESIVKLLNITPATSMENPGQIAKVNGVITLEFDGTVTSVTAITPGGMSDPTINHTATAKAGTDGKVWEINLGDRTNFGSSETEGNPIIEVDVTATAADGIVILSDTRADRGLELKYELVDNAGPANVVTLGSPVWSVAENAEIEASTSSINIKFPNATNVESTYTLEVSGTINTQNENPVLVSGTGTMTNGADITVNLSEDRGYNLIIGTITVKDGNGATVYSTDKANFQLNFGTTGSQSGNNTIVASGNKDDVAFKFDIANVAPSYNVDITLNGNKVELDYDDDWSVTDVLHLKNADLADGEYTLVCPPSSLVLNEADGNTEEFSVTFYIVDGIVTMTAPTTQPTSVVLYEKGVNAEVAASVEGDSQRDLIIEGDGVTLTISNTSTSSMGKYFNNAYINNSKGGIVTTNTNVMKFTSSRAIEKIEFTANKTITQKNGTNCVGTFANNVWNGEASEISIAIGENVTNISKIVVYFKDTTTGISNATTVNVENGKMYNLAGQQVKNAKGIVIVNGKKYIAK